MQVGQLALSAGDNFADGGQYQGGGNVGVAGNFSNGGGNWHRLFPAGSDASILAAHPNFDSGIVTSGPSEVAFDVPANISTVKLLGIAESGHQLQETRTVTYVGRSVANQYKASVASFQKYNSNVSPEVPVPSAGVAYGGTSAEALDNLRVIVLSYMPDSGMYSGFPWVAPYFLAGGGVTMYALANAIQRALYIASNFVLALFGTIYYLDTHETITYAMV